jgi:hypothetical protein
MHIISLHLVLHIFDGTLIRWKLNFNETKPNWALYHLTYVYQQFALARVKRSCVPEVVWQRMDRDVRPCVTLSLSRSARECPPQIAPMSSIHHVGYCVSCHL